MAAPLRLAVALADGGPRRPVLHHHALARASSSTSPTTPSPAGSRSPSHDDPADGPGLASPTTSPGAGTTSLVVVDPPADTPALRTGLLAALAPHTRRTTVVVTP